MHFVDHSIKLSSEVHYDWLSSSTVPLPTENKSRLPRQILLTRTTKNTYHNTSSMAPQIKALVFVVLLLFVISGLSDGFKNAAKLTYPNSEEVIRLMGRKLIEVDAMLDYEKPGSNPAHNPDNGGKPPHKGGSVNN